MPIEIRMPVRIVGARGRQDHGEGAPDGADFQRARDVDPFLAHGRARRTRVLSSIGHTEQMKMTKIAEIEESLMV
jgi:hypothetical protein